MTMRASLLGLCCLAFAGCSALINPDESQLGNPTGTDGGVDMGDPTDMGPRDGGSDSGPTCPASCDDSVECTVDSCVDGACVHEPNNDLCGGGERCSRRNGCVPYHCSTASDCDDGLYCNGVETCDPGGAGTGCINGEAVNCADTFECTTDTCNDTTDSCDHTGDNTACGDSVACTVDTCDPTASDHDARGCAFVPDNSVCESNYCLPGATCNPMIGCVGGAPRVCPADADPCTDTVCSSEEMMCVNTPHDGDSDTYAAHTVPGGSCEGTDCDDANPNIHPGATEICNGHDDDCNGSVDEGCSDRPDTCDTAWPIAIGLDGHGHVSGNIDAFSSDISMHCGGAPTSGKDAVYYFDLAFTSDVVIETTGTSFDTLLAASETCDRDMFETACHDDVVPTVDIQSRIFLHRAGPRLPATSQRIYVVLKGYSGSAGGDFELDVRVSLASNDTCFSPIDISEGGLLVGWTGNALLGSDMYSGMCASPGSAGRESISTISMPSDGTCQIDVQSYDFTPIVYVRRPACAGASEVDCAVGSDAGGDLFAAELNLDSLTAERYNIIVDGAPTGLARYTLRYQP